MAGADTIRRIRKVAIISAIGLAGLIVLAGLALAIGAAWLNSNGGRAWLAGEIAARNQAGQIPFRVAAIRGNPLGEFDVSHLEVTDKNGVWLTAPTAQLSWRPMALLSGRVEIASLSAPDAVWQRQPSYGGGGEKKASSGWIEAYVLGAANITARVDWLEGAPTFVADAGGDYRKGGSANLKLDLRSEEAAKDEAHLDLTWAADARSFDVVLQLTGPAGGLFARLAGLAGQGDLTVEAEGSGPIDAWNGHVTASLGADYSLSTTVEAAGEDAALISGNARFAALADPNLARILGRKADIQGRIAAASDGRTDVNLDLQPADGRAVLSFTLDRSGHIEDQRFGIEATLNPMEWPGIADPAPTTGPAKFSGTLTGRLARFMLAGRLDVANVTSAIANADSTSADLRLDRDQDNWHWQMTAVGKGLAWQGGVKTLPTSPDYSAETSGDYRRGSGLITVDVAGFNLGWASGRGSYTPGGNDRGANAALDARVRLPNLLQDQSTLTAGLTDVSLKAAQEAEDRPWSGTLTLHGSAVAFQDTAVSELVGDAPDLAVTFTSADLSRFDISQGRLRVRGGTVSFSGPAGRDSLALSYQASLTSLGDLLPENLTFAGALDVAGLIAGTPSEPRLSGAFTVNRVDIDRLLLTDVATAFTFAAPFDRWRASLNASGNSQYGPVSAALSGARQANGDIALADINLAVSTLNLAGDMTRSASGDWQGALRGELRQDDTPGVTPLIQGNGEFALEIYPAGEHAWLALDANLVGLEFVAPGGTLVNVGALSGRLVANGRAPFVAPGTDLGIRDLSYRNLHLVEAQLTAGDGPDGGAMARLSGSYLESFDATVRFQPVAEGDVGERYSISLDGEFAGQTIATDPEPATLTVGPRLLQAEVPGIVIGDGRLTGKFARREGAVSAALQVTDIDLAIIPATQLAGFRGGRMSAKGEISLDQTTEAATWDFAIRDVAPVDAFDDSETTFRFESTGSAGDRKVQLDATVFYGSERTGALTADFRYLRNKDGGFEIDAEAPVSATFDWAGDVAPLWAFARLPDHALEGRLEGGLQIAGTLDAPEFEGDASLQDGTYSYYPSGLRLAAVRADISGRGDRISITNLSGNDGNGGTLSASGAVQISPELTFPGTIRIQADHLRLLRRDEIRGTVSADLTYQRRGDAASLTGDMTANQVDAELVSQLPHSVVDIEYRDLDAEGVEASANGSTPKQGRTRAELNIDGKLPGQVFVRGRGLDTEWEGNLQLKGTTAEPRLSGELNLRRGTFDLVGRRFDIREGRLTFLGERRIDPEVNILAEATTPNIRAQVSITGRISSPVIEISSSPPLPEDEVIARLLFGTSVTELSAFQVAEVASAISTLRGNNSLDIMGRARRSLGLDTFYVAPTGDGESGFTVTGGKYLRHNVFVEVQQKTAVSNRETRLRIDYASRFRAESSFGPERGNGLKLKLFWDY